MDEPNTESNLDVSAFVGSVLDRSYRVTRLIAEGGMGAVYEAVHLRLNKPVAIKILARQMASNDEALARFRREAEVTSRLGHPHLVQVIDFGTCPSGEPYLVMECLNGEDLDQRLRRVGRLPLQTVVEITRQAASALAAAHTEGVVHRDLKPANLFLVRVPGEDDFVKILDFGVSKIKAARTKLTRAATVIGTPDYMSPEQATGLVDEIDHRTDQWALGCIAWEMLAGRAPFIADDVTALFYQIVHMDPHPLSKRVPGLPTGVETTLRRALAKQSADRFPSIKDFSRALEAAAGWGRTSQGSDEIAMSASQQRTETPTQPDVAPGIHDTLVVPEMKVPTELLEEGATAPSAPVQGDQLAKPPTRTWSPASPRSRLMVAGAIVVVLLGAAILLWPRRAPAPTSPASAPQAPAKTDEVASSAAAAAAVREPSPPSEPAPQPVPTPSVAAADGGLQPSEAERPGKTKAPRTGKPKARPVEPVQDPKPKRSLIEEL